MSGTVDLPSAAGLALYNALISELQDAFATRYLSVAGLVVLLYDHVLTFNDEVSLVWRAPASFPKYAFLFNRYLVLGCLLAVAYEMCGFIGITLSDIGCRSLLFTTSILAIFSIGIANILVLLRVVILWDHRPIVVKLMTVGFITSFSAQVVTLGFSLSKLAPNVVWSTEAQMCITTTTTPIFVAVWACPMLYEILVLFSTVLNALDRPRGAQLPITKALYRDGIIYFVALTGLRALNLAFAALRKPALVMLGAFFVWAMTTTVLNRSLLRLRQAEVEEDIPPSSGRASPFHSRKSTVDIETPKHYRPARFKP
ncbi:unnamed protein product [Somion occarium]|uniref:DUF6533 domain-containing protein n=1 Tax=Somion occarium TaxID=3059160 RepID=A0ABP1DK70_9APHY